MTQTSTDYILTPMIPSNIDAEQAVIGSLLIDPDAIISVLPILADGRDFYIEKHGWIYDAICKIYDARESIDYLSVQTELERAGKLTQCGGAAYLTSLLTTVPSAYNVETHARAVERTATQRKLIAVSGEIAGIAYDGQDLASDELFNAAYSKLLERDRSKRAGAITLKQCYADFLDPLEKMLNHETSEWGLPTGLTDLDVVLGGLPYGEMTLIAADPGKGKTFLGLTIWLNAGKVGHKGIFFSLEMRKEQLMMRLCAERANVKQSDIRRGKLNDYQMRELTNRMAELCETRQLFLYDGIIDTVGLEREILKLQHTDNIDFAIVDYSDLLLDSGENEIVRQKRLAHRLKIVAKRTGVALIVVHPINREGSQDEPPTLRNLGWGRAWEYDAHTVLFPFFKESRAENDFSAMVKIGKYRDGISGKALDFYFDGKRWADKAK